MTLHVPSKRLTNSPADGETRGARIGGSTHLGTSTRESPIKSGPEALTAHPEETPVLLDEPATTIPIPVYRYTLETPELAPQEPELFLTIKLI